ncbi:MAG: hypothetical protein WB760_01825 [Xanthobacteraceae bacterium]
MYAFLLLLGAVITAAGLGLVASGVSIQDHTFDATNVLPALIAVIGGCILIGLSFVVRALQRVERALMVRPMPRPARLGEIGGAAPPTTQPNEPARIPFPPKPKAAPHLQPVPLAARPVPSVGRSPESLQEAVPLVVEESDVSLLPKAPVRLDDESGDVDHSVSGRPNGAGQVKTAPRFTVAVRPARKPQQQPEDSVFSTLWPKAPASASTPEVDLAPAVQVTPPPPAPHSADSSEPTPQAPPAAVRQAAPAPVSILKSGVVEGMAYTLYSDGSIEAQLPGGTVRFGSITELRNHIEKNG